MTKEAYRRFSFRAAGPTLALVISGVLAQAQPSPQFLPNMGQQITPLAPTGSAFQPLNPGLADKPDWLAGQAVSTVVSPNGKTLLVLTSGFNRVYNTDTVPAVTSAATPPWHPPDSNEYVFIYDISNLTPTQTQVLQVPNTYNGIVFDPSGTHFYVAGGPNDNLHIYSLSPATPSAPATWAEDPSSPLPLGHSAGGVGLSVSACAAGVAISSDGQTLVVVNYYNDSITVFTGGYGAWLKQAELDLRPGKSASNPQQGVPGGEYPFWVAVKGKGQSATAYVSSIRDREIDVVNLGGTPAVAARIHVTGQPNRMTLNAAQTFLYVAEDQSDTVDVIDTVKNAVVETIPVVASVVPSPVAQYKGANPNSVTLSEPDEKQLYVTNGNLNCIAVVALGGTNSGDHVVGLIPTGWYPNSVSVVHAGGASPLSPASVYAANGKSPTGPNPGFCYGGYGPPLSKTCMESNQYNPQLTKAGLQSFPLPEPAQLATLTQQVAANNHFAGTESASDAAVMAAVRAGVKHVIFIIKENRTYDQVLGDLGIGNGDPDLTEFGEAITPNLHNLARSFVTLDNFLDTAEVSYDGWLWSTSAQAPDVVERQYPVAYALRGTSLDSDGLNRNVNVAIPTLAGRLAANPLTPQDPDALAGQTNVSAPDGPENEINTGYLWNAALRAGLRVRNYGFFVDGTRYQLPPTLSRYAIPVLRDPFATRTQVAFPANADLAPFTDPYFRGFDNALPDYWRYTEWVRDFDARYVNGHHAGRSTEDLPALTLVRLMHDHTGNYTTGSGGPGAIDGVNTPDLEVADNDYAVGLLVQKIASSVYANSTLIFIVEDDAQDGGDHVDSHRSIAFVAGAWVKQGALVSTPYNTINFLRTIEEVLGLPPMNLNDALAAPMADIFNTTPSPWSFTPAPAPILYNTSLPLPPAPTGMVAPKPAHDAKYWARVTRGMDFSDADRVDPALFNSILWKGMMGDKPYPAAPSGMDLRQNREELLARYRLSQKRKTAAEPRQKAPPAPKAGTD